MTVVGPDTEHHRLYLVLQLAIVKVFDHPNNRKFLSVDNDLFTNGRMRIIKIADMKLFLTFLR